MTAKYHFTRNTTITQVETAIDDVFSTVRICKMTHAEMCERTSRIVAALNRKYSNGKRALPAFMGVYAGGYIAARRNDVWRNDVEYCYRDNAGVLFSTHTESIHRKTGEFYASGRGCELANMPSGHYWKGTNKPFGGSAK